MLVRVIIAYFRFVRVRLFFVFFDGGGGGGGGGHAASTVTSTA